MIAVEQTDVVLIITGLLFATPVLQERLVFLVKVVSGPVLERAIGDILLVLL